MDRAVAFYREVFGFTPIVESTHYTLIRRGVASVGGQVGDPVRVDDRFG